LASGRAGFSQSRGIAWITRRAPFGPATLVDEDLTADFSKQTGPGDIVSVVATRPLTRDETWTTMRSGSFVVFRRGVAHPGVRVPGRGMPASAGAAA